MTTSPKGSLFSPILESKVENMPQNENPESKDAIHLSKFGLEDNNEPILPPDITDEEHQKITEKTSADYMNSKMKQ